MGIKTATAAITGSHNKKSTRELLETTLADITALRTTVAALVVDNANRLANHNTLIAKLNLDGGVTDVNYAVATAATSSAPAALTLKA